MTNTGAPGRLSVHALLGTVVFDVNGERVGKIEELCAVQSGDVLEIRQYFVGAHGALLRIASRPILRWLFEYFGVRARRAHAIPWDWLDLSDPARPRLVHPRAELRVLGRLSAATGE